MAEPQEKPQTPSQQANRPLDIPAGAAPGGPSAGYQPQPARVQSPIYGGAGFGVPQQQHQAKPAAGRRLTIGQGITLSGEIEACEYLVVEGTVEAALKGASVLEISESGVFYGTVEINEATVAGRFEAHLAKQMRALIDGPQDGRRAA